MSTAPVLVEGGLALRARAAADAACDHLFRIQRADHWCAELESNATITAEYVMMCQALGLADVLERRRDAIARWLFAHQKPDGSWGIAWNLPGDVSTTVESYLALRILGLPRDDVRLLDAERFVRGAGGVAKIRVFTRIHLALFGLFPWGAVPAIPPEVILLPDAAPVNIYRLASWARGTMVPLFVILHHRPSFPLPHGMRADALDPLWLDPSSKAVPYRSSVLETIAEHGPGWKALFNASDVAMRLHDRRRALPGVSALRRYALGRCERWILEHQEASGDWAGIFPPMVNGVLALRLAGHALDSDPVRRGLEAIERFAIDDAGGFRVEACQSPVWDSALALVGLADAGHDGADPRLATVRAWLERKQILEEHGDWRVYNRRGEPGGWSFEHVNTWYPDVDDTAAVLLAFVKGDSSYRLREVVRRGTAWMVSMQNPDGGWAAFDMENDRTFLNQIPFSDMDSLCDPSSPDVTGRVLEALGVVAHRGHAEACRRGLEYLRASQEPEGSWFGRWGVNYVYGTSNVLNGLARQGVPASDPMVARALAWLECVQNPDGGFGEGLESYADRAAMGRGPSTASQTAWGAMGLLAYRPASDVAAARAIRWLVDRQTSDGTWDEEEFTGTGFPRHFYLRYHLYRHYFPLMALGRFAAAAGTERGAPAAAPARSA